MASVPALGAGGRGFESNRSDQKEPELRREFMERPANEPLLINELQLLLAEKRTYFALLRTGIAVFTLPLTIIGFLLATSSYHRLFAQPAVAWLTISSLLLISTIGLWLTQHAGRKVHHLNDLINKIRGENDRLAELVV